MFSIFLRNYLSLSEILIIFNAFVTKFAEHGYSSKCDDITYVKVYIG